MLGDPRTLRVAINVLPLWDVEETILMAGSARLRYPHHERAHSSLPATSNGQLRRARETVTALGDWPSPTIHFHQASKQADPARLSQR